DGIRDRNVTGFQTCALPIFIENLKGSDGNDAGDFRAQVYFTSGNAKGNKPTYEKNGKEYFLPGYTVINDMMLMATGCELPDADRSEERRVGKEGERSSGRGR